MKMTDLMVRDWIQVKRGFDGHLTNEMVKGLLDDDTELYPITLATGETVSLDDVVLIPLTEEILVKSGFKFQRHEFKTTNDDYWISDDKRIIFRGEHMTNSFNKWSVHVDTEDMRTMAYLEITYVHQLQHLLQLCGIKKEITL